ncbi:MAG: PIN domain nuclease [Candidatus Rokuibacteriota bacterium]|nr:MAG: PIN domain nuclease [Candidatus Rokubacteria bacterium]
MRLVADANVLLSAVTGGRARLVLARADLADVVTTVAALDEVNEYAEPLARKLRLPLGTVLLAVATLPVTVVDRDEYAASLREAGRRIGQRDPDDIDTFALALHLHAPVWSNDRDFEGAGVEWYTTARLLKTLELGHG